VCPLLPAPIPEECAASRPLSRAAPPKARRRDRHKDSHSGFHARTATEPACPPRLTECGRLRLAATNLSIRQRPLLLSEHPSSLRLPADDRESECRPQFFPGKRRHLERRKPVNHPIECAEFAAELSFRPENAAVPEHGWHPIASACRKSEKPAQPAPV